MRLHSVQLQNFRGFDEITVRLDSSLTVIVGNNGVGKTSLLDATCLGLFTLRSFWPENSQRKYHYPTIEDSDIAISKEIFSISLETSYSGERTAKQTLQFAIASDRTSSKQSLRRLSDIGYQQWEAEPIPQPLFAYYRQNRGFHSGPYPSHRTDIATVLSETVLREQSLSEDLHAIPDLSLWWDNLDAQEARYCRDIDNSYRDPQLEAVRNLIQEMDEFESVSFRAKTMRPGLYLKKKDGPDLHVEQLSSGERVYLILLADLARRLQIIQPNAKLKDIPGIILIDEIELNLHPNWQRKIVSTLTRIFESCQFIVSTHSPQVIGQIKDGKLATLYKDDAGVIKSAESAETYGRDSNDILIDILRSTERDGEIKAELEQIERLISLDQIEKARQLISSLRKEIGSSPVELDIAEQRLRRREERLK